MSSEQPLCGGIRGNIKETDRSRHDEIVEKFRKHIGKLENGSYEIVDIEDTKEQVVGGMKYYCHGLFKHIHENVHYKAVITIYERAWENYIEVNIENKQKVDL